VLWRNYDNTLSHFHRIPERDGQTDGQNCYINIAHQYTDKKWTRYLKVVWKVTQYELLDFYDFWRDILKGLCRHLVHHYRQTHDVLVEDLYSVHSNCSSDTGPYAHHLYEKCKTQSTCKRLLTDGASVKFGVFWFNFVRCFCYVLTWLLLTYLQSLSFFTKCIKYWINFCNGVNQCMAWQCRLKTNTLLLIIQFTFSSSSTCDTDCQCLRFSFNVMSTL